MVRIIRELNVATEYTVHRHIAARSVSGLSFSRASVLEKMTLRLISGLDVAHERSVAQNFL